MRKEATSGQQDVIGRDLNGLAFVGEEKTELPQRRHNPPEPPTVSCAQRVVVQHDVRAGNLPVGDVHEGVVAGDDNAAR